MKYFHFILSLFMNDWKGVLMKWGVTFVFDIAKVAMIVIGLSFGLYWANNTQIHIIKPSPNKADESKAKRKPLLPWRADLQDEAPVLIGKISLGADKAPDGTPVRIGFPPSEDIRNIGSHKDGYGMCVMSSIEMAARWANLESFRGLRDWCAQEKGGGYPAKVDDQIERFAKAQAENVEPSYLQYEGDSLEFLQLVIKTYRFAAVTYSGRDGVRYKGKIAHMVCLAHLDDKWAAIYDNNGKPGELIWMTPKEFKDRWIGGENGWVFAWTAPPPPPKVVIP